MNLPDDRTRLAHRATVDLLVAIRQASVGRGHRRSLLAATGMDLAGTERWILHSIPDGSLVPMSHVAALVGAPLPVISRACSGLVKSQLLVRIADPRDRRRMLVGLTDDAHEALERWWSVWPSRYLAAVSGWEPHQVRCLNDWLDSVTAYVQGVTDRSAVPARRRTSRPDAAGVSADRRQLRATIEMLVPSAGRMDLQDFATPTAPTISSSLLQVLLTIASHRELSAAELATVSDVDPALARRRIQSLSDTGFLASTDGATRSIRATPSGLLLVEQFYEARAAELPVPSERLIDHGLAERLVQFVTALTTGPGYAS